MKPFLSGGFVECSQCHRNNPPFNNTGLCKTCTENLLVPMFCPECKHRWKTPGLGAWCPQCGNTNVTSEDIIIDEWIWNKEAELNGVEFKGIQKGFGTYPDMPLFNHPQYGSFVIGKGETLAQSIDRKHHQFLEGIISNE